MNRHFTKENIQMANKHMERRSTRLAIREMRIKDLIIYDHAAIKMMKVKFKKLTKCMKGCGVTGS